MHARTEREKERERENEGVEGGINKVDPVEVGINTHLAHN
jgi:hypothetical protein